MPLSFGNIFINIFINRLFDEAGFPQHKLVPHVTRLPFFVPEKKRVIIEEGKIPSKKAMEKQINETSYLQFFERNKLEHDAFLKFQKKLLKTNTNKLKLVKDTNKRLGYVSLF
jgi:hypothetical protein